MPHRYPQRRHRSLAAGVVTLCVLLLASCSQPSPPATDGAAPEGAAADWSPCGGTLECTTLSVPADWNDPEGERISLEVARRPATSGTARGVVLVNPGGPGASGVTWLAGVGDLAGVGEHLDLVSWDPRGVGASTRLDCAGVGGPDGIEVHRAPTTGPDAPTTEEATAALVAACASGSPGLVDHLGTDQGVADMDAVRVAIGAERVDVIGFSYGTYLGLAYARAYPERVDALVLDAVVDPAAGLEELLTAQAVAMEATVAQALAASNLDPTGGLWDAAALRTDPTTLAFAAIAASYDPTTLRTLPDALSRAAGGDGSSLRSLAEGYFGASTFTAYLGTLCADLDRPSDAASHAAMAERISSVAPRLGGAIAGEVAACARWPVAKGARWLPEVPAGVPVVVIGATGDTATPLPFAESVAAAVEGATLVVREGDGHVSLRRSPCVANVVRQLLADDIRPPAPLRCPI